MIVQAGRFVVCAAASLLLAASWFKLYDVAIAFAMETAGTSQILMTALAVAEISIGLLLAFNLGSRWSLAAVGSLFLLFAIISTYSQITDGRCACLGRGVSLGWSIPAMDVALCLAAWVAYFLHRQTSVSVNSEPWRWRATCLSITLLTIVLMVACYSSVKLGGGKYFGRSELQVKSMNCFLDPESTQVACHCRLFNPTTGPLQVHGMVSSCGVSVAVVPNQLIPANGEFELHLSLRRGVIASQGAFLRFYVSSSSGVSEDQVLLP